ncbi:hypothetical protein BDN70DRAFT_874919 [Pholiota conissans]|uniref:Uncharacterized protein n=1 Tax=Pholiota conissans TaxID=109636 RepID=A0A9P5Z8H3_9AGAR|nr:hypothetical protein BDN70DRAFT_874919 [Pholiota conissans]
MHVDTCISPSSRCINPSLPSHRHPDPISSPNPSGASVGYFQRSFILDTHLWSKT